MICTANHTYWASAKAQILPQLPVVGLRIICFHMVHLCLWYVIKVLISWHSNIDGFHPLKALLQGGDPYKSLCGPVNCAVLWDIFPPGLDQNNDYTWNCQDYLKRKQNQWKQTKSNIILRKNILKNCLTHMKYLQGCCQEYENGNKCVCIYIPILKQEMTGRY